MLQAGPNYARWGGYNTIEQAQDDGAVIMACKVPPPPLFKSLFTYWLL